MKKNFVQLSNLLLGSCLALLWACGGAEQQTAQTNETTPTKDSVVNVYTHRHYDADKQLFETFTKQTGIKVNVVQADADPLMKRMEDEGQNSPADLLITVDAARLFRAKEKGLLQPFNSATIEQQIPAYLQDEDNYWVALTRRARVIVYDKTKVKPEQLSTYQSLTDAKWKGKILIRSSDNVYNQSLLAAIVAHQGEEKAKKWAEGVVKNFAREPKGNDTDQLKALLAGEGSLAVVNTYYVGKMFTSQEADLKEASQKLGVAFPVIEGKGTHFNISGVGIAKYAPNKEFAVRLLEFLTSAEAQQVFAEANQEYPANQSVAPSATLQSFGTFQADTLNLNLLGKFNSNAVMVFDQAKWK